MLIESRGLSEPDLAAVADLERRVVANDGGRLKLEWSTLRSRSGDQVDDLTWRSEGAVTGFLGLYSFGGDLELAGMVDPAARRTGIGSQLLDAARRIARERGLESALLVTPRDTAASRAFAAAQGGVLHHSEHFLALDAAPVPSDTDQPILLRPAVESDGDEVIRILAAAFDEEPRGFTLSRRGEAELTWVVERDAVVVGTVRLTRDGRVGSVYGFGVDPAVQGQGIGRAALRQACRWLWEDGAEHITLEVEVDNDRALGLYLSVGFERVATDDYYRIQLVGS